MREIKFRAWYKENKIMIDNDFINKEASFFFLYDEINQEWLREKDIILMQYTGLKDKNGKEIYSSDILKHPDVIGSEFYVRWNNERARFQLENKEGKELMAQLFDNEYFIIGNEFKGLTN